MLNRVTTFLIKISTVTLASLCIFLLTGCPPSCPPISYVSPEDLEMKKIVITEPQETCSVGDRRDVKGVYAKDVKEDIWVFVWPENMAEKGWPQSEAAELGKPAFKKNGEWSVICHFRDSQQYEIAVYTATEYASQFIGEMLKQWYRNKDYPGILLEDLPDGLIERARITVK